MKYNRKDNKMIDCTDAVYAENEIKLSWPIRQTVVYDKNEIAQWHD